MQVYMHYIQHVIQRFIQNIIIYLDKMAIYHCNFKSEKKSMQLTAIMYLCFSNTCGSVSPACQTAL